MKREIIYIGYYDTPRSRYTHFAPPSGSSKMQYVARTMASCGYPVRICSLARPLSSKPTFFKAEDVQDSDGVCVHFFHYWGVNHLLLRKLSTIWQMVCLFFVICQSHLCIETNRGLPTDFGGGRDLSGCQAGLWL